MKNYTITIKDHTTGSINEFETDGILGAFIDKEVSPGNTDTTQFALGKLEAKEVVKLLAGCTNMVYHLTEDTVTATNLIKVSNKVAFEGYKEQKIKGH